MKKALLFLSVFLTLTIQAQERYSATFNPDDLSLATVQGGDGFSYTKVMLNKSDGTINEVGTPQLPTKTIRLIIPFGKAVQSVTCSDIVMEEYRLSNRVYPAERQDTIVPVFAKPDSVIYQSNHVFPSNNVIEKQQGYFDGNNNIVTIEFCPFEYYPLSGLLKMITSVNLTVNYSDGFQGGIQNITRLQKTQDMYDALLHNLVDNPDAIADYRRNSNIVSRLDTTDTGLPVYEYVIIAPENYRDTIHDFIEWKRQKGNWAGMVSLEQILAKYPEGDTIGTYPIEDTPGCIRQFLRDSYSKGTSHVFIVGVNSSADQIRFGYLADNAPNTSFWLTRPSTDWYFNDMTGNWNHDADTCYGEPSDDSPSNMWSLHVGRLLCSAPTEFGNWMRKLLTYEKNPGDGNTSYLTQSIMTADSTMIGDANGTEQYLPSCFQDTIIVNYTSGNTIHPTGSEVIGALNSNSYGLMFWHNHGGTGNDHSGIRVSKNSSLGLEWKLVAEDIHDPLNCTENGNGLDNIVYRYSPFIICSEACSVVPFEKNKATSSIQRRNCGESFTVGNYGGVAFLGFCVDNGSGNTCMEFAKELSPSQIYDTEAQLGTICDKVKIQRDSWRYNFNLIGDPECRIWTDIPTSLMVTTQSTWLMEYVKGEVEVTIMGLATQEKARVTLYSEDDIFQTMVVSADNPVALFDSVFPVTNTPVTVTVTSVNHLPNQSLLPVSTQCAVDICSDTTWANNFLATCDYIVHSGATLTITCDVGFNSNCKIQVLPGGQLVLDGGRLYCSILRNQWQGVRVLGEGGSGNQSAVNNQFFQGFVDLKNNAIIQDARVAVDLWDGIHLNTTGGIVHAENTVFLNNGMAVRALYFQNKFPNGYISEYNAWFNNCEFTVNSSYPPLGEVFRHQAELVMVKGVKFMGCSFLLNNCPAGLFTSDNSAIYAFNAGFTVNRFCTNIMYNPCHDEDYVYGSFDGFNMGVNAISTSSTFPVTVNNAYFQNNTFGIRSYGETNPTILFNSFVIGKNGECGVGVYMDNTHMFCIEENSFSKDSHASQNTDCIGIVVKDSRNGNLIYRNTFTNLTCANYAIDCNWSGSANRNGLEYQCNENIGNEIDFYVKSKGIGNYSGIQNYQGLITNAAGNTFSQSGVTYQFYNAPTNTVNYYYNPNNSNETPQSAYIYNVNPQVANSSNDCPAHYTNGGGAPVLRAHDRQQRESEYYTSYDNYWNTKALYESFLDGGSTIDELRDIANATSNDAWSLRAQLLRHSPFLSQETMRAMAGRDDILASSAIFEILASNPEELGRDSLIAYLEEKENPLPEYMLNILKELANGNTYRSVLESQMVHYQQEFSLAAGDIVRSIMNDSVTDPDELREWLGRMENIHADRQIVSSYLNEGDHSTAFSLAELLPELYGLEGDALKEHQGYMKLLNLRKKMDEQGRMETELTLSEMALVDSLAAYGTGSAQTIATGYHELVRGVTTSDCPDIDILRSRTSQESSTGIAPDSMAEALGLRVSVNPNPTRNRTTVDFTIPEGVDQAVMTVVGPKGDVVKTLVLSGRHGQHMLDLAGFAKGVYVYTVECNGLRASGKIVLE